MRTSENKKHSLHLLKSETQVNSFERCKLVFPRIRSCAQKMCKTNFKSQTGLSYLKNVFKNFFKLYLIIIINKYWHILINKEEN